MTSNASSPLDAEILRRRLVSARVLTGLDQLEMGERLQAEGLGKTDATRLERGAISFTSAHHAAYVRITELPPEWFTAGKIKTLFVRSIGEGGESWERMPELADTKRLRVARSLLTAIDHMRETFGVDEAELREALSRGEVPEPLFRPEPGELEQGIEEIFDGGDSPGEGAPPASETREADG